MEFRLGHWNVFLSRHICSCAKKSCCKELDTSQPGIVKGCYRGNYFILEKLNTKQKG